MPRLQAVWHCACRCNPLANLFLVQADCNKVTMGRFSCFHIIVVIWLVFTYSVIWAYYICTLKWDASCSSGHSVPRDVQAIMVIRTTVRTVKPRRFWATGRNSFMAPGVVQSINRFRRSATLSLHPLPLSNHGSSATWPRDNDYDLKKDLLKGVEAIIQVKDCSSLYSKFFKGITSYLWSDWGVPFAEGHIIQVRFLDSRNRLFFSHEGCCPRTLGL